MACCQALLCVPISDSHSPITSHICILHSGSSRDLLSGKKQLLTCLSTMLSQAPRLGNQKPVGKRRAAVHSKAGYLTEGKTTQTWGYTLKSSTVQWEARAIPKNPTPF